MIDIFKLLRRIRLSYTRLKLFFSYDKERTIICNNCLAGFIAHDYGLRFNSPFVNLMVSPTHYIEMLQDIGNIVSWTFKDITPYGHKYPIGLLNSRWEIHFMHYHSYEDAVKKWRARTLRMNMEKLYVIFVETHSCTYKDIEEFDKLSFKKKIIVTHKSWPNVNSVSIISHYDGQNRNGELFWPTNRWGKRVYDEINWLHFLDFKKI